MTHTEKQFEQIVDEYQNMVVNVCLHYFYNREDAEDVAQDVFVHVFEHLEDFRKDAEMKTWIYQIAVHTSLEELRYRNRSKRKWSLKSLFSDYKNEPEFQNRDLGTNPGLSMEQQELGRTLQNAIYTLTEDQQTAFILTQMEQLSNKEAAEIMNTSVSSIESLLFRARKQLRKQLASTYEEWNDGGNTQ